MLNINLIRENTSLVVSALKKRGFEVDFTEFLEQDKRRRELLTEVEAIKATRNKVSATIPALKKEGKDTEHIFAEMRELGDKVSEIEKELESLTEKINDFLHGLPNMPDEDIVAGGKEKNEVVEVFGEKPKFNFTPKNHVELCEDLGLIDYVRGAKIAGSGNWIYKGVGARLEWALLNFFMEEHEKDGYEFMLLPHMLNYECGFGAGQFPKFKDDVYILDNTDENLKFLLPTSETALVNLHRQEILEESELPKKYYAYTPCYRKEAGSYRAEERGMIRGHQFNKVEMVQYATPEQSDAGFKELVRKAQNLVEKLGLHYQLSKLAAEDISASMARTYDVEVWIPSMEIYKEVSSASNARDYQARRGNIRYRNKETGKVEFLHTLNASGLATSRVFPAILEQYQNEDGSVTIPEVLRKYMGGMEKIEPIKK